MISLPSKQPTLCVTVPVRKKRRISYLSSQSSVSTASAGPKELRTYCTESNYWLPPAITTATRCRRRRRRCRTSRTTTTAAAAAPVAKEDRGVSQITKISTIFANIWMRMSHLYKKSSKYTRGLRTQKKNLNDPKFEQHVLTKIFTILSLSLKL